MYGPVRVYCCTGFSSEIGTKLRESAIGQAGGSYYSRAALSSNDSKMLVHQWNSEKTVLKPRCTIHFVS